MAQSSGYGAGPGSVDIPAGVTGGTGGTTGYDAGQSSGSGATDQAKDKAQQAAGQAKEQAQQVAGQAKGVLRNQVDQRSTQAGQTIKSQASDIRSVGDQLRSQGKEGPAKVADQAAERIERVGDYLHRADADALIDDVERFARSNPWAILAGGLGLGFIAARALKASSVERYQAGGGIARRQQLPPAGGTTGTVGTGATSGTANTGTATGGGFGNGGTGGGYVGGGISGTTPASTTVPPSTSVPPVRDVPGTPGTGTPPAGGF